jgi:hypothetical protein
LPITLLGTEMIPDQMQEMVGGTKQVASFQASTSVERRDFGVGVGNWAATMVVGGKVDIEILLEAMTSRDRLGRVRQASQVSAGALAAPAGLPDPERSSRSSLQHSEPR